MNIALVASNIHVDATKEDLNTIYSPLVGFIKTQCEDILGKKLSFDDIVKEFRNIVLTLPKAHRLPAKATEYYALVKKALVAA